MRRAIACYGSSYQGFYPPVKPGKSDASLMHQNGAEKQPRWHQMAHVNLCLLHYV